AREEERLLALHRVGPLVGHVERVRAQIAVALLLARAEGLAVVTELLEDPLALLQQPLLEVAELLLGHRLELLGLHRLLGAGAPRRAAGRHQVWSLVRVTRTVRPSSSNVCVV